MNARGGLLVGLVAVAAAAGLVVALTVGGPEDTPTPGTPGSSGAGGGSACERLAQEDRDSATPDDAPPGADEVSYPGYRLVHDFDLSRDEGWTLETGKPSNSEGLDRPENVCFGAGPDGTSMLVVGNRDEPGGPFHTGDAKALFQPVPNFHRTRAVVEFDPMVKGMWPALWKRPLAGDGEIDDWEKFGHYLGKPHEDAGALHTTPYDETHRQVSRDLPDLGHGRHLIETELTPEAFTWWVDGTYIAKVTRAEFDEGVGRDAWLPMFGQPDKEWYARVTLQAGGNLGGPIPDDLMQWRLWVHDLAVYGKS